MPRGGGVQPGDGERRDEPIDRPRRPCANSGRRFQPTLRRRLLCGPCFAGTNLPQGGGVT